jgi:hypothetical protein
LSSPAPIRLLALAAPLSQATAGGKDMGVPVPPARERVYVNGRDKTKVDRF